MIKSNINKENDLQILHFYKLIFKYNTFKSTKISFNFVWIKVQHDNLHFYMCNIYLVTI